MSGFAAGAKGNTEISDNRGTTVAYTGTATTTVANVPSVAGEAISQCLVQSLDKNLEVSFDGGTTYFPFERNGLLTWDVKGRPTQLKVRTSAATCPYRIIINFEESS